MAKCFLCTDQAIARCDVCNTPLCDLHMAGHTMTDCQDIEKIQNLMSKMRHRTYVQDSVILYNKANKHWKRWKIVSNYPGDNEGSTTYVSNEKELTETVIRLARHPKTTRISISTFRPDQE